MPEYVIDFVYGKDTRGQPVTGFKQMKAENRAAAIDQMQKWHGVRMSQITDVRELPSWVGERPSTVTRKFKVGFKFVVRINRVRLNRGGYDSSGQYFGVGAPLFMYYSDQNQDAYGHVRAGDRAEAKEKIIKALVNKGFPREEFSVR